MGDMLNMTGCPRQLSSLRRWPVGVLALMLTLLFAGVARADEPPTKPILRIETGMHSGLIKDLAVDTAETFFATCSLDGTVRVWDLASGELQKTLRVPYGPDCALYSLSISPDGKQIATGGTAGYIWDKSVGIYLFDRVSGKIARRFTGLPNATQSIRFSPDGKYLAAGLAGDDGLRVIRVADGVVVAEDKDYNADCVDVTFRADGSLAASGLDGMVRLYSPDFKLQIRKKMVGGTHPHGLAFSPDGNKLAVGFGDTKSVNVLAVKDLSLLYAPVTDNVKLPFAAFDEVAWSPDGKKLYGAGRAAVMINDLPMRFIRRWDDEGKGKSVDAPATAETITALVPLKLGPVLFASGDPLWGVLEDTTARVFKSPNIDMRLTTFLVSDDASVVQISVTPNDKDTLRFNTAQRKLETGIADSTEAAVKKGKAAGLHPAFIQVPGLVVTDWENGMHPKVNGHPITLSMNEAGRSLAILPDNKHFLLGCDFSLRLLDGEGKETWALPTPGTIWQLNVSKDGSKGVALLNDGTIRWLNVKDGTLLMSVFVHNDQKQWVAWSPGGYYDSAAGSEDLIGWHINHTKEQAGDFYPASRFRSTFNRPDVVERVLSAGGEAEALRLADADRGRKTDVVRVDETLPPIVAIKSPDNNTEAAAAVVTLQFAIRTPGDAPVTSVRALVDGRPTGNARKIQEVAGKESLETTQSLDVTLPAHDCEISIIAENKNGISAPATIRMRWKGKAEEDLVKPKLYILSVGVSKYKNPAYALDFAAKDASDFTDAMKKQSGKMYRSVETRVLTDDQASKDALLDGLEWIQKQTTSRDVAMIFLSGHGVRDGSGDYYYVPYAFDMEHKRSTGVLFYEIEKTIKDIAGKVVFFVDTCHSGGAAGKTRGIDNDIVSLVNELSSAENGAIVFAASTGKESALEDVKWGHGAFTKALLEGLEGKADLRGNGRITITSLDFFLSERVKELTDGSQHPTTTKPPSVPDFPIAIVK
jgi:WD40 repeat protein